MMDILKELQSLSETEYKTFNGKIIPTKQKMLGVRLPSLRKIAKRIVKENAYDFIQADKNNIYEMVMLEGIVLTLLGRSFKELLPLTERFLDKVDNWAQIDSTMGHFKNIEKDKEEVLVVVRQWLKSEKEFVVRAGLIILLARYVQQENLPMIFNLSQKVAHTGYYVHMGNAWLISVCMAKFPEETLEFFENNSLDSATHNKAIQKSRESLRVSSKHKILLNTLKRKNA